MKKIGCGLIIILFLIAGKAGAQCTVTLTSDGTDNQTICSGVAIDAITYATTGANGASFSHLPDGVTGIWQNDEITISGTPSETGEFNYSVTLEGCDAIANGTITVTPVNTISRTSPGSTESQTHCSGSPITDITYSTTGATGANFSGLPPGVTGEWSDDVVIISGTPTSFSGSPFHYTVNLIGGCGDASANGTITVTQGNTITLSSDSETDNQETCMDTELTDITYTTTGANGATFSGLPAGVTGRWSANTVTISGTPSVSGTFNYTIHLSGGCGTTTADGRITVHNLPVATLVSSDPNNTICAGTSVTFTATGGTNYNFFVGGSSRQNGSSATFTTSTLTNGEHVRVVVTANSCTSDPAEIVMTVNQPPSISQTGGQSCSPDLSTYSFSVNVNRGTVTSSAGTVTSVGSNTWQISAVPSGVSVIVRVTDSEGCFNTLDVSAPECDCPALVPPVSGGNESFCQNGELPAINATVPAGETVDWYNASTGGTLLLAGSLSYTPSAAGTYYAGARNTTNGCVSSTRTAITLNADPAPVPVLTSSDADNSFCQGTSIVFTAEGGTGFNFLVNGASVQNGSQHIYTSNNLSDHSIVSVVVTNAEGCSATSAGITNTVVSLPSVVLTSSDSDNRFCTGTSVTFTANAGSAFNFRVDGVSVQNGASPSFTTSSLTDGQVVDVIVTNSNSCIATSAQITNSVSAMPVISAGTGGDNCGLAFHLNGNLSIGTGTWTKDIGPGNVTFTPNAHSPNATVNVNAYGNYTFRWTVINGSCTTSEAVSINFIQQSAADAGPGGDRCNKEFIFNALPITSGTGTWTKINGPGNPVFTPDNHQPNAKVTVDQSGTYDFAWTVVNNTCTSSDIVRVGFHDSPQVNAGADTVMCKGGNVQLQATGSGTASWTPVTHINNPNVINPVVSPEITTTYRVEITDQFGCKNTDEIIIGVLNNPVANAGSDQTIVSATTATMDASLPGALESGYWSVVTGSATFADSTFAKTDAENLVTGENKMVWTLSNGICPISHDTANIYVNDFVIPTLITPNMDGRNDYFVLGGLSAAGKTELIVFDRRGLKVYSNPDYDNSWDGVDSNNKPLPEDTYFYSLKTESGRILKGFIVISR